VNYRRQPHRAYLANEQKGATLLIGMIMLILITLMTLTVYRVSTTHTKVVNNEQLRSEAVSAANVALDAFLSTEVSTWNQYEGMVGKELGVNLGNLDGTAAIASNTVSVSLRNLECRRARVIKNSELIKESAGIKYVTPDDSFCFGSGGTSLTIVDVSAIGSPSDDSLCANVLYEVVAVSNDPKLLNASATISQGVEVRRGLDALSECD
jgi:Tfp pilus assembly protein PilX